MWSCGVTVGAGEDKVWVLTAAVYTVFIAAFWWLGLVAWSVHLPVHAFGLELIVPYVLDCISLLLSILLCSVARPSS